MERERWNDLPDELVERIIARLPFPYIFKARGLSKSWLARFSSVSSLQGTAMKCRAIAFQKLVRERSGNWATFSPVSIDQIAYNPASQSWQRMPSLGNLPWKANSRQQIIGPLLFASRRPEFRSWNEVKRCRGEFRHRPDLYIIYGDDCPAPHELHMPNELYVANMLTRSWKLLPPRPNAALGHAYLETLLINQSSETYIVIAFCRDHSDDGICNGYSAQIYDSKSATWSSKQLSNPTFFFGALSSHAYFNGVIYMIHDASMECLLAYDVEARTWEELRLSDDAYLDDTWCVDLVVCNSNLMMVVQVGEPPSVDCLQVLKVDLESRQLWKVARCPPRSLNLRTFKASPPVSDGRCIFLGYDKSDGRLVAKNVDEIIISWKEKKRMKKMKIKEKKEMMKIMLKEQKEKLKIVKKNMKMHDADEEEDDEDEDDEDDEDFEDFEDSDDEDDFGPFGHFVHHGDEEDEEGYDEDEEDEENEWSCFHSPPDPEMTMTDLRDREIPNNAQRAKRSRKRKDRVRNYKWCSSSFQPGLIPFMAV